MDPIKKAYEALHQAFPDGLKSGDALKFAGMLATDVLIGCSEENRRELTEGFVDAIYRIVLKLHPVTKH